MNTWLKSWYWMATMKRGNSVPLILALVLTATVMLTGCIQIKLTLPWKKQSTNDQNSTITNVPDVNGARVDRSPTK